MNINTEQCSPHTHKQSVCLLGDSFWRLRNAVQHAKTERADFYQNRPHQLKKELQQDGVQEQASIQDVHGDIECF